MKTFVFYIYHLMKKKSKKLLGLANDIIFKAIQKGITDFNFISETNIQIHSANKIEHLSFQGADIWTVKLSSIVMENLNLSYSRIRGIPTINYCNINRIYILNSQVSSYLSFEDCKVNLFLITNTEFRSSDNLLRQQSSDYGFHLRNSTIETFRAKNNEYKLPLMFDHSEINEIDLTKSRFQICPSFFNTNFSNENK